MDQSIGAHREVAPFDTRRIAVDEIHSLYLEQSGNPEGLPAVFLHGGPGSGCQAAHRRLFDPARFRVVLFDQRGAGRSQPKRCLERNTTQDLIADLERIREALGIERWTIVGGSWGSLLGIAYAQAHPDRVCAMALRAIFLGTAEEIDWAFGRGPQTFYPELWRAFTGLLPKAERADPIPAYGARLLDPDPAVHLPAARIWHDFERALSQLQSGKIGLATRFDEALRGRSDDPSTPYFEWHYIRHGFFLKPGELLAKTRDLAGIPAVLVQGRYDLLCPPVTAHALASEWPGAELRLVPGAGHDAGEPGITVTLAAAIDELGRRLG